KARISADCSIDASFITSSFFAISSIAATPRLPIQRAMGKMKLVATIIATRAVSVNATLSTSFALAVLSALAISLLPPFAADDQADLFSGPAAEPHDDDGVERACDQNALDLRRGSETEDVVPNHHLRDIDRERPLHDGARRRRPPSPLVRDVLLHRELALP